MLGRSSEEGHSNPLQYSCLKNPMDREAWWATIHRVTKSRTWLNDFTFTFTFSPGNFLPSSDRKTSHLYSGVCLKLPMVSTNDRGPKTEPWDGNELGNDTWLSAFVAMSHEEKKYIISLKVVENKHLQNICPFIIFKENSSQKLE